MFRVILYVALLVLFARALSRLWNGVMEGIGDPRAHRAPQTPIAGVQMQRDPVCGTFVVPTTAVRLQNGSRIEYFCSARCRDEFRSRLNHAQGRTA